MATEQVAPRPGSDATRTLALVHHEGRDGGAVHRTHLTHPLPIGRQPDVKFIGVRYDSLDEHLLVVSLSVRTYLRPGAAASVSVHVVQAEDLEGCERRGAGLRGDHPSEACHRPGAHVVVIGAN